MTVSFAQALRNIRETPPRLEDSIVTQVWGWSDYDEHHLDPIELASRVRDNVSWLLDALEHPESDPRRIPGFDVVEAVAIEIGERRAIQGVGIDAVIGSWRTAERAIHERIVALAATVEVGELLAAVGKASALIGALTDASVAGYRRTQSEVTEHYDRLTSDLVSRIIGRSGLSADEVAERARVVEADPRAHYAAIAVGTVSAPGSADAAAGGQHALRHLLGHLAHRVGGRILVGRTALANGTERPLLLVPIRADSTRDLVAQLREGVRRADASLEVVAGVSSSTATLVDAYGPARQARLALEVALQEAHGRRVDAFTDVAVQALLVGDPETAALLAARLDPIAARPELVETLRAWFDAGRSSRAAARALFVHANTVPHRLATIARMLGRDLGGDDDLLDLELALRARALRG